MKTKVVIGDIPRKLAKDRLEDATVVMDAITEQFTQFSINALSQIDEKCDEEGVTDFRKRKRLKSGRKKITRIRDNTTFLRNITLFWEI